MEDAAACRQMRRAVQDSKTGALTGLRVSNPSPSALFHNELRPSTFGFSRARFRGVVKSVVFPWPEALLDLVEVNAHIAVLQVKLSVPHGHFDSRVSRRSLTAY
jgi:hypothetical protein